MEERSKSGSNLNDALAGWRAWLPGSKKETDAGNHHWAADQGSCYECQALFTLFNRRQYCGLCGRGFCSKCTKHTLPVAGPGPSGDEAASYYKSDGESGSQTRVCNFCYNLRKQQSRGDGSRSSLDAAEVDSNGRHSPQHANGLIRQRGGDGGASSHAVDIADGGSWRRRLPNGGAHEDGEPRRKERAVSPGDYGSRSEEEDDDDEQAETNKQLARARRLGSSPKQRTRSRRIRQRQYASLGSEDESVDESTTDTERIARPGGWSGSYGWHGADMEKVTERGMAGEGGGAPVLEDQKGPPGMESASRASAIGTGEGEPHRSGDGAHGSSKLPPRPPTAPSASGEGGGLKHARQDSAEAALNPGCHMRQDSLDADSFALHDDATNHDFGSLYADAGETVERPKPDQRSLAVEDSDNSQLWVPPAPESDEEEVPPEEDHEGGDEEDNEEGGWEGEDDEDDDWDEKERERARRRRRLRRNSRSSKSTASEMHKKVLRSVSDDHFRALVAQLLSAEGLPVGGGGDSEGWLDIVAALASRAASMIRLDQKKTGTMDPGGYIKVKCVGTGTKGDSDVVKGVVCRKNVAHRRMSHPKRNPRLLLLGGALEYQRSAGQLSSLEQVLQQEREHLNVLVARIEQHKPDVLLVEKAVSGYAQERLLQSQISLVLNLKPGLMERISRCTGGQIMPPGDPLVAPKIGHCEMFHVERFVEEHGSAGQEGRKGTKTLMYFEGCLKPLGCTILLKGASGDELKRVKRVTQFAAFAAYHLSLETSFLADEGATLPTSSTSAFLASLRSSRPAPLYIQPSPSASSGGEYLTGSFSQNSPLSAAHLTSDGPSARLRQTRRQPLPILSVSPNVSFPPEESPDTPLSHKWPPEVPAGPEVVSSPAPQSVSGLSSAPSSPKPVPSQSLSPAPTEPKQGALVTPPSDGGSLLEPANSAKSEDFSFQPLHPSSDAPTATPLLRSSSSRELKEALPGAIFNGPAALSLQSEEQRAAQLLALPHTVTPLPVGSPGKGLANGGLALDQVSDACGTPLGSFSKVAPSPSEHQSILVSLSSRCLSKGTVCDRAHLVRIKYYGSTDMPLGHFLRNGLFNTRHRCPRCDEPSDAHVRTYTHRQGSLTISVRRLKRGQTLPAGTSSGEPRIWMWHRCLRCPRDVNGLPPSSKRVVMSDAASSLSFGKFLELSFSNHVAASRLASCGHSIHRDCLRFYGCEGMIACFRYAPILLHAVHLPDPRLEFNNPSQQQWLVEEVHDVADKAELVFAEVLDTLRVIGERLCGQAGRTTTPEARRCIVELEALLVKEKAAFEEHLFEISKKMPQHTGGVEQAPGEPIADVLELNRLRRELAIGSFQWDSRLHYLASSLKLRKPTRAEGPSSLDDHALFLASRGPSPPPADQAEKEGKIEGKEGAEGTEKTDGGQGEEKQGDGDAASEGVAQASASKEGSDAKSAKVGEVTGAEATKETSSEKDKASQKADGLEHAPSSVDSVGAGSSHVRQVAGGEHVLESFVQGSNILGALPAPLLSDEKAKSLVEGRIVEQDRQDSLAANAAPADETSGTQVADLVARAGAVVERFLAGESLSGEGKAGEELADLRAEEDLVAAAIAQAHGGSDNVASPTACRPKQSWDRAQVERLEQIAESVGARTKAGGDAGVEQPAGEESRGGELRGDFSPADAGVYRTNSAGPTASWPAPGELEGGPQQSPDPVQSGALGVRRVLSEGHLPILADLSATLDAAWTGEAPRDMPAVAAALAEKQGTEGVAVPLEAPEQQGESGAAPTASQRSESDSADTGSAAPSAPTSPSKRGEEARDEDRSAWAFSTLYKAALAPTSPPRDAAGGAAGGAMPSVVSHAAQVAAQGGARIMLPVGHDEVVVAVYDDEPSSVIAYALCSEDYQAQLRGAANGRSRRETSLSRESGEGGKGGAEQGEGNEEAGGGGDKKGVGKDGEKGADRGEVEDPLLSMEPVHIKTSFTDDAPQGKVKFSVTIYYARQFEALRRKCCGGDLDFARSLCRCRKWHSSGGKSNVFFAKTLDDRFVIKQVTRTELLSFLEFGPDYFKYLSDALSTGAPTCLAKTLGIYQVHAKHAKSGRESRMDVVVMENLLYGRRIARIYDLKGSTRSRYNADASGRNSVLLDENLLEAMPTDPIFVGNKGKRLLERAVWNDTQFLASVYVMDYSLLVGVDEERCELVLGIIDFFRQYTWDKHLETWVKASGILGGSKNAAPTVISPKQYKKRFRKAMSTYFVMVPDQWTPPLIRAGSSDETKGDDDEASSSLGVNDAGGPEGIAATSHPHKEDGD